MAIFVIIAALGIYKFNFTNDDIYIDTGGKINSKDGTYVIDSEQEARLLAEKTCIKGGEAIGAGIYNENIKTWWFDANLNATQENCNRACVVNTETKTAEVNWRCRGLLPPIESTSEDIKQLFVAKYPKYAETVAVSVNQETQKHARGAVSFITGAPGGIFLAAKINDVWQLVFDGNGAISCNLVDDYGFPDEMLFDCAK